MQIITSSEGLDKYYTDTVANEATKYKWQKTRLIVVLDKDGTERLEARKLSFFERIGVLFGGKASFRRVVAFCDKNNLMSDGLFRAIRKYNRTHVKEIRSKQVLAEAISSYIKSLFPEKTMVGAESINPVEVLIKRVLQDRRISKMLSNLEPKEAYEVLEKIQPRELGFFIFYNKMCAVLQQINAHHIQLPNHEILPIAYTASTKLRDIQDNIAKALPESKVVLLRKDIIKDAWLPIDLKEEEPEEAWQLEHLAVGIVDPSGRGIIYALPADPQVTQAHSTDKVDWEGVD